MTTWPVPRSLSTGLISCRALTLFRLLLMPGPEPLPPQAPSTPGPPAAAAWRPVEIAAWECAVIASNKGGSWGFKQGSPWPTCSTAPARGSEKARTQ